MISAAKEGPIQAYQLRQSEIFLRGNRSLLLPRHWMRPQSFLNDCFEIYPKKQA
jgi:hypothetical protein